MRGIVFTDQSNAKDGFIEELKGIEMIEIHNDDVSKTIIMANHKTWQESLNTNNPINFTILYNNQTLNDMKVCSEFTVNGLEEYANNLLKIVAKLRELTHEIQSKQE